jgi:hypothetical protein
VRQFSVVRRGDAFGVVVDSDLLPKQRSVVVIPLIEGFPRAGALNPAFVVAGRERVLHTRGITTAPVDRLEIVGDTLEGHRDAIVRAVDILIGGV